MLRFTTLLAIAITLPACANTTTTHQSEETQSPIPIKTDKVLIGLPSLELIKKEKAHLRALTSETQCNTHNQCQIQAVGSRACGGPSEYIVYSTKSVEQQKVIQLADNITRMESAYNAQHKIISTCQFEQAPNTQCVENKCVKLKHSAVNEKAF